MPGGIVAIGIRGQRTNRDQTVGAQAVQGNKQAETRNSTDPRRKGRADALGEEGGDITVDRVALRGGGASLRPGDVIGDRLQVDGTFRE